MAPDYVKMCVLYTKRSKKGKKCGKVIKNTEFFYKQSKASLKNVCAYSLCCGWFLLMYTWAIFSRYTLKEVTIHSKVLLKD